MTMQFFMIGGVKRVDFCAIEGLDDYCSAFVHFMYYMENTYVYDMLSLLERGHSQKLQVSPSEYWILLKNNNPVPETRLNMHQVAENARLLEERVLSLESQAFKQEQENFDLRTQVITQKQQMERLEKMVYQMQVEIQDAKFYKEFFDREQQMARDLWHKKYGHDLHEDNGPMTVDEVQMDDESTWCDGKWVDAYSEDKVIDEKEEGEVDEDMYADMPPLIPVDQDDEECYQVSRFGSGMDKVYSLDFVV
jgi:hypothetical protein